METAAYQDSVCLWVPICIESNIFSCKPYFLSDQASNWVQRSLLSVVAAIPMKLYKNTVVGILIVLVGGLEQSLSGLSPDSVGGDVAQRELQGWEWEARDGTNINWCVAEEIGELWVYSTQDSCVDQEEGFWVVMQQIEILS